MSIEEFVDALHYYEQIGYENKCCIQKCQNKPKFRIDWLSFNQYDKDPLNLIQIYSCENPHHLLRFPLEIYYSYGFPDRIIEIKEKKEKKELLDLINSNLNKELSKITLEKIALNADIFKNQLLLNL